MDCEVRSPVEPTGMKILFLFIEAPSRRGVGADEAKKNNKKTKNKKKQTNKKKNRKRILYCKQLSSVG